MQFIEPILIDDGKKGRFTKIDENGGTFEKEESKDVIHRPIKRVWSSLQIYLGDVTIPANRFQEQPFICKYIRQSYDEARAKYQNWSNWDFVKPGQQKFSNVNPYWWRLNKLENDEVEEIHYIDPWNDEYMIILNGVLMFNEPAPCPYRITNDRRYNFVMSTLKEMGCDYAYGKPLTASAKTLQGLNSESIRLLIEKFRQGIKPAMGTSGKRILSKDIYSAGSITYGLKQNQLFPINPNQQSGITSGEFNFYQLIEQKTEEFIGAGNINQGVQGGGVPTATEVVNAQKQFIKNLGLAVLALTEAKQEATFLRIYNIFENFTSPVKKEINPLTKEIRSIYKRFTINNATLSNGKTGTKIVQFTDQPLAQEDKERIREFEQGEEMAGRNIRIRTINTKMLNSIPMILDINVEPKERDGSSLEKVLYTEKLNQAAQLSQLLGERLDPTTWKENFSFIYKMKKPFLEDPNAGASAEVDQQGQELLGEIDKLKQTRVGDQMLEGQMEGTTKPSINTVGQQ